MKKSILSALIALCLFATFAVADTYVEDHIGLYINMECPAVTLDDNITDGSATYIYYNYRLLDPDGIVRDASGLLPYDKTTVIAACNYDADKEGIWTCEGELIYQTTTWTGTEWLNAGGICNDDSVDVEVLPIQICGDGITDTGEECDDGNNVNNDGCSENCKTEYCGDGVVQIGEACDGTPNCELDCTLTPPPTGTTFTLHQDIASEEFILEDTYVRKVRNLAYPNDKNYGTSRSLYIEAQDGTNRLRRTYQKLDLSAITNNPNYLGSVQNVKMTMTTDGHNNGHPFMIYKVPNTWNEYAMTWNNQICGTDFGLCNSNTNIMNVENVTRALNGDWLWELDITELVNEALTEGKTEVSIAYKLMNEPGYTGKYYGRMMYSKEMTSTCLKYTGVWATYYCRTHPIMEVTI